MQNLSRSPSDVSFNLDPWFQEVSRITATPLGIVAAEDFYGRPSMALSTEHFLLNRAEEDGGAITGRRS